MSRVQKEELCSSSMLSETANEPDNEYGIIAQHNC